MKLRLILLVFLCLFVFSCKHHAKRTVQMGEYFFEVRELDCETDLPEGYSFVVFENGVKDRHIRLLLDGPQYFEFTIDPKRDKELVLKSGSYNMIFLTPGIHSDFRSIQTVYFNEKTCYGHYFDIFQQYKDYEITGEQTPIKEK